MLAIILLAGVAIFFILGSMSNQNQNDSSIPPAPNAVVGAIAQAIATAEGYFVSGSRPANNNNPGDISDLTMGEITATGSDAGGLSIFASISDGWNALYAKIQNILSGQSSVYSPDASLSTIGNTWSDGDPNWAANVASSLGVSPDNSLNDVVAGNGSDE